jgi:hypothetical protein
VHVSWGAFEVNVTASVASLLFALIWLAGWRRTRHGYMLTLAAGWVGLCAYWGMIAISAGPAPEISRAAIASVIREELLVSIALLAAGKLAMLRLAYRYRAGNG